MLLVPCARAVPIACVLSGIAVGSAAAQDPTAQAKAIFQAFDLNSSGWLSGREVAACDCRQAGGNLNSMSCTRH
jgi:hypothetical protein